MRVYTISLSIALALFALLATLALFARAPEPAQAEVAEAVYVPLPRACVGVNPPGVPVPACCAFGYIFDADSGAVNGAVATITSAAGVIFTATTASGPHSTVPYFTVDLEAQGVHVGDTITLTTQVGGRQRTLVYPDVVAGGQQIDLVVPRSDRSEAWTTYMTDTFTSITALAQDGNHTWVGSGGQGAARLDLTNGAAITYVRPVTASLYNDVRGLVPDGTGSVWWATAGGGAVRLDPDGPVWEHFKVYNSGILGNYLGGVVVGADGAPWFAGWAPTQALAYSVTVDNLNAGFSSSGATYVEDSWTGSCRGIRGDARWTPSLNPPGTTDVDWVVYTPTLPSVGAYRVYVHVPRFYTEAWGQPLQDTANARYQVTHDGGTTVIPIVQDGNWCQWILLGEFNFTPGSGQRVYLGDYTSGEDPRRAVLADAVKWERVSDGLEIIVDDSDGDANFGLSNVAAWTVQTDPWHPDGCRPVGRSAEWMVSRYPGYTNDIYWAQWQPNLLYDGLYDVDVTFPRFYTGLSDTSNALYKVHDVNGTTTVPRVQTDQWCTWTSLGQFTFDPGTGGTVYLGNYTGENPQTSLILDAVRWVYREGTSLGGVSHLSGATWLTDTIPGGSYALAFDATRALWVGTVSGLARRNPGGGWVTYTSGNSDLPLGQVTVLAVDDERGQIWLGDGSGGGLAVYTPTTEVWQAYTPPFTDVAAIAVDTAGLVWIGSASDGGLAVLRPDGSWVSYTAGTSNLLGDRVLALSADPDGGVWIGATAAEAGQHSGVVHLEVGTSPVATIQAIKPSNPVQTQDMVEFRADGLDTDEDGAAILRYEWTSSLMAASLGSTSRFTLPASALPAGQHTIYLRVMDNEGTWSAPVETSLRVIPPHSWRFLLYLDGDNNLAPYLERALNQLEQTDIPSQVTVLVLIDGPNNNDTYRYEVQPGGIYQDGVNRWHLPEANMGSHQVLRDFITWAKTNYTADYTYLAIADHGRGTQGLAWDDTSGQDELLTPLELREALRLATGDGATPIEVVHLDACLMGLLEQAYQVSPYADYLIASENLAWSVFPYTDYTQGVGIATSPNELAASVVLSYSAQLSGTVSYPHTIAALDLSAVPTVTVAVDDLADALIASLPQSSDSIGQAWIATQHFDSRDYYTIDTQDEYLDLFDFAAQLSSTVTDTDVVSAAVALQAIESDLVLAERHLSGQPDIGGQIYDWSLDGAHGVALYFPPDNTAWGYDLYLMDTFRFTEDTSWDEFLLAYLGEAAQPPGGSEEPGRPPVPTVEDHRVFLPLAVRNASVR
jgi:sugar lactone lactonase YvrE